MHKPIKEFLDNPSVYLFQPKPRSLYESTLFILLLPWMMAANLNCQKPDALAPAPAIFSPPSTSIDVNDAPAKEVDQASPEHNPYAPSAPPYDPHDQSGLPEDPPPSYEPELEKAYQQQMEQLDEEEAAMKDALKKAAHAPTPLTKKEAKKKAEECLEEARSCVKKCKGGWLCFGYEKVIIDKAKKEERWARSNAGARLKLFGPYFQRKRATEKLKAVGKLNGKLKMAEEWLLKMDKYITDAEKLGSRKKYKALRKKKAKCSGKILGLYQRLAPYLQIPGVVQQTQGASQSTFLWESTY